MRCATFGAVVCKASMLDWRRGSICHRYMCIVLYIYRSAIRCAKFGVVVFKASMLNCSGTIYHGNMCIVLYMKLIWCNGCAEIYVQLEEGETCCVMVL